MEEKKPIKINLKIAIFLFIIVVVIFALGIWYYVGTLKKDKNVNVNIESENSNIVNNTEVSENTSDNELNEVKQKEENSIVTKLVPSGFSGSSLYEVDYYSNGDVYLITKSGENENATKTLIAKNATGIERDGDGEDFKAIIIKGENVEIKNKGYNWITFENKNSENIKIIDYRDRANTQEYEITSHEDISTMKEYIEELKPLPVEEMVDLALIEEVEVQYGESISVVIDLNEKNYCNYKDGNNEYAIAKMPEGLYDLIVNKYL